MHPYHQKHVAKITHLEIIVKDLVAMKDFYTKKLGFSVYRESNHILDLSINGVDAILRFIENPQAEINSNSNRLYHFALLLPNRSDLGIFLRHVIDQQIPIVGGADHGVSEAIYLQDIEHNGIEIAWDTPQNQWNDEFGSLQMVTKELDYSGVYYAAQDHQSFTVLPQESVLGHVHLSVSSIEKAKSFYVDALGFSETKTDSPSSIFAGSNGYHHHIGINQWKSLIKRSDALTGLKSLTVSYPKCEDIATVFNNLKLHGYSVFETEFGYQTTDSDGTIVNLVLS